jgi:hypothetical protein
LQVSGSKANLTPRRKERKDKFGSENNDPEKFFCEILLALALLAPLREKRFGLKGLKNSAGGRN